MSSPLALADLREAAIALASIRSPSAMRVAAGLSAIMAGADPRDIFVFPASADRTARRDELLRALRQRHYRRLSDNDAAQRIARDWTRYAATPAFEHDRALSPAEAVSPGTIREFLAAIAAVPAKVPSARQVRRIVGHDPMEMANVMRESSGSEGDLHGNRTPRHDRN
ncbi:MULTISPECIES: hypothetical protein [unclassified Sphingobium]|uniref:hypothetical protein n=1 Tax=unclassified Sphingobium TaxID=2611147 RepID=UPI0035A68A47